MRQIKSLLKENAELAALSGHADSLAASQNIWSSIVPDNLKNHSQAAGIKHKRLTVYADNGAVAAKIKLLLPSLLTKLQKQGLEVTSIRVLVQVQSLTPKPEKTPRTLSQNAARSIRQLAEELKDTPLGEALSKLSTRTRI